MNFTKDDYVTVRQDLMQSNSILGVTYTMKDYIGKSFFIKSVYDANTHEPRRYTIDSSIYVWDDTMLELGVLPEEYIVECNEKILCNNVIEYFYNEYGAISYSKWLYVICHKNGFDANSFNLLIPHEYRHLPVFTYEQWEKVKVYTEKLNKEKQNMEIKSIEIPSGYEFDKVENGIIKLKEISNQILTHRDILNQEAGGRCFLLRPGSIDEMTSLSRANALHKLDCVSMRDAERAIAFIALMRIANYYNKHYANNWEPDWKAPSQAKHYVFFNNNKSRYELSLNGLHNEGHIYFATPQLAQLALENNKEIFQAYWQ